MQKHVKIYLDYFGLTIADFIECEVCKSEAVDIHHIEQKGMGGSKNKNYIENLCALCREHHIQAHANIITKDQIKDIHLKYMKKNGK